MPDLSPELARRLDDNHIAYWSAYAETPGGMSERFPGAILSGGPIPHPLFNAVFLTGLEPRTIDRAVEAAHDRVGASGVPMLWRVSPAAAGPDLDARLASAGLKAAGCQPAMLADLSALPPAPQIPGFRIAGMQDAADLESWGRLTCKAFGLPDEAGIAMGASEAAFPRTLRAGQPRFMGYLDGEPVAVSSTVMAAGIAGIYAVATLPQARGKGIGTAMTLHAMAEGLRRGAAQSVLQATEMGRPVYERIGFSRVFDYTLYMLG